MTAQPIDPSQPTTALPPGVIPIGVAICCREWFVPIGYGGGSCGICGERPTFDRILPEDQWITPAAPIRPEATQ